MFPGKWLQKLMSKVHYVRLQCDAEKPNHATNHLFGPLPSTVVQWWFHSSGMLCSTEW
jgi:hypothetical protein